MNFVDMDQVLFYAHGEYDWRYTINHFEFFGLLRALEILVECGWHTRGDYIRIIIWGAS